jgi:hypothetical protein
VTGLLPSLNLEIQPSVYERLVKIGDCFAPPKQEKIEAQEKVK